MITIQQSPRSAPYLVLMRVAETQRFVWVERRPKDRRVFPRDSSPDRRKA